MRLRNAIILILSILGIGGAWQLIGTVASEQIPIERHMIYDLSAHGRPYALFDEQYLGKKERANNQYPHPRKSWSPGFEKKEMYLPIEVVIDMKKTFQLHTLSMFDTTGSGLCTIEYGNPGDWILLCEDSLTRYGQWGLKRFENKPQTRFLRFRFYTPGAEIGEILIFGKKIAEAPANPVSTLRKPAPGPVSFDAFCGINGFINDPFERLAPVAGILREYHRWDWDEGNEDTTYQGYPNNAYAFEPSWARGEQWAWNFDQFYTKAKQNGLQVSPSLGGCAPYLRGYDPKRSEEKPILPNTDPQIPSSYAALADYAFQFAARYGTQQLDDNRLKLAEGQARHSGLDLIAYLEDGNEPDRWWQGPKAYHSPVHYVARLSAFFDGHGGSLGENAGVKQADPDLPVVMGGLARPDTHYLRAMQFWATYNRSDGQFPADVINLHHYCNSGGDQWAAGKTKGLSPEDDKLYERLKGLVAYRNRNLSDRELWFSEFGYDTNPVSPQHAPAWGELDAAEMQARWLTRSLLIAQAAGIDRAFVYMLRDVSAESTVRYNSSGLTRELWHAHEPKVSWYYIAALRNALKGYFFKQKQSLDSPDIHAYTFVHRNSTDSIVIVWTSQEEQKNLAADAFAPKWIVELTDKQRSGTLRSPDGKPLTISGKPLILGFGKRPARRQKLKLNVTGDAATLFDEQTVAGDPAIGLGGAPTTSWKVPWGAKKRSCTFAIGDQVSLSDIWVYDGEGSDSMWVEIADREKGPFRRIAAMKLNQYNTWRRMDGTVWRGSVLRVTLGGGGIGELVLYGN